MSALKCVIYYILLGIATHFFGESLPRDRFDPSRFPFTQFEWEKDGRFYRFLKVKRWKNRLPDAGDYWNDMAPKRISGKVSSNTLDALVKETCVSESIHYLLCCFSPYSCHIWPGGGGLVLCVISIAANLMFVVIQRYNRPHLIRLSNWLRAREGRRGYGAYTEKRCGIGT